MSDDKPPYVDYAPELGLSEIEARERGCWSFCMDCKRNFQRPCQPGEKPNYWDSMITASQCPRCKTAEARSLGMHPEVKYRGFVS
jgi:hypothetical protein